VTEKPAAPEIVRRGCLAKVAGDQSSRDVTVKALAFLDLRFDDGHVERWFGSAYVRTYPTGADFLAEATTIAEDVVEQLGPDLLGELEWSFAGVPNRVTGPIETVVEWNAQLDPEDLRPNPWLEQES
jgi:hypothetical protein